MNRDFWLGKRVFITGHTGFKGGWLSLWLADMGAEVHGYALAAPTKPSFYETNNLHDILASELIADIRDPVELTQALKAAQPDIVFHMAAQPLVRQSYSDPVATYAINVMGTVNLLEALRSSSSVRAVVNVTTDKCYENKEWAWPYRENEALGGLDPYSSSKACSELISGAYRHSFFSTNNIRLATARAGNVIGGGDWAQDRLLPDFFRAIEAGEIFTLRNPNAIRPWQHVLEPLSGYLRLAEKLFTAGSDFAQSWNFGPASEDARPVRWIAEQLCERMPQASWQHDSTVQPHEASILKLDSTLAKTHLGWRPRWNLNTALERTLDWQQAWKTGADMQNISLQQIQAYEATRPIP